MERYDGGGVPLMEPSTTRTTGRFWSVLKSWADPFRNQNHEETALFVLTLLIGAIVGLVVVAFIVVTENLGSRMYPAGGSAWRRLVVPTLGALITGFLLYRHFPNARGSGIPQTKTALYLREGVIYFRTVLGKFFLSAVSLASGIALGREGPSVQVGAGIASTLGRRIGLGPNRIKSLIPIGASAALAAAFNTPIAAVLFTLEEVMGDLNAPVLGSIVLSSATSWVVLHLLLGDEPLFHVPAYQLVHPAEFLFYAVLGLVGGLVSVSFVKLLLWLRKGFFRMPQWTAAYQPVAGGLLVGLIGWFVPDVLGVGYNHVSQALNGQLVLRTMALLVILKLVATAMCYASGNAGGIFGPSLFIGAMMGGAVGGAAHFVLPDYTGSVGAYALVGMGAAFAGIIRVPLTSVIMIFEVTRDYSIIVPLMIANLSSYYVSSRLQDEPIYEALLGQDGIRLPRGARAREELLTVAEGVRPAASVVSASETVADTLRRAPAEESVWPVVDSSGLLGMVTRDRLRQAADQAAGELTVSSLMPSLGSWDTVNAETFPHVHPDQAVDTALRRMAQSGLDVLPVVSRSNQRQLLGVISVHDAIAAYGTEPRSAEPAYKESRTPVRLLAGLLVVLVAIAGLAGILNYVYREQRSARATEYYQAGNKLMTAERYPEAVEQFRNALSISHSSRDRLALAQVLEKTGRFGEAEVYFREVLKDHHDSGPANLGLGQIAADRGDVRDAVEYYHRAIYGVWPDQRQPHQVQTRIELVQALGRLRKRDEARAELLALVADVPEDVVVRKQLGHLLLDYGLAQESATVYRKVLEKDRRDVNAIMGLAEAELAQNHYRAAQDEFNAALRLTPGDSTASSRLQLVERILAIDPAAHGLGPQDRYQRSRKLLETALGSLDECLGTTEGVPPGSARELSDETRKMLLRPARPRHSGETTEDNVARAERLWGARTELCGPPQTPDEPLSRMMVQFAGERH